RHLQAIVEGDTHHRIHLILRQAEIAHHHRVVAGAREGGPGGEPHRRRQVHTARHRMEIAARDGDLEDALFLVEVCRGPGAPREAASVSERDPRRGAVLHGAVAQLSYTVLGDRRTRTLALEAASRLSRERWIAALTRREALIDGEHAPALQLGREELAQVGDG